ncbi:Ti-type conjugative transfer relaxase TraA [Sphingomonas sp. MAH-20]|uniref:Ti-type conjugative transfer relaxase TraA n=1 Tax=Sphingomonas horti TaxID=2682842 RepID=A0A6I4J0C3_9SPHN|nr:MULTISPECIES: Ti-type conjugative transfer relaxase TraA [Sphingomonas]MBA2920642.1 Ti-type conjugative transfer relaxase TraA [Sphingomonas sp. CGMCC 1.13658]MVO77578.1 Ti-type conjugative transfer relaxase TraA [Sphingomonas horti]
MAIYHFSAKVISRANGSSALAAAAYRSASRLHDQRLDRHHDFSNKACVVHSEVMLPDGAPEKWRDREQLWNAAEAAEKRIDAQLAREIEFAIPREMTREQGIALARDFIEREFVGRGMIADLNVHWDVGADGLAKPHAHVMLTTRELGEDCFGAKVRDWNRTELLNHWREAWADHVNERLAELDIDARIDHRSLEAQGIDLEPQNKIGPAASRMAEQGLASERLVEHHAIARANGEKIIARPQIALDAITHQQATFTTRDLAMFVHRHSDGKQQFDDVMAAVRSSPELVRLGQDGRGQERFTSRAMLQAEQSLERATIAMAERNGHAPHRGMVELAQAMAEKRGLELGWEQQIALHHVTRPGDLKTIIGYAGTGKSALLGIAREAWEESGYRVHGLALSGIAAENLEHGSGIASRTIASLEHQWSQGRELLTSNDVLVIDEAGMIGTRQMERIVREAERRGAKLVLVGDPEQLQAIEAGAAFRSIAERHGAIEITEVRRQQKDWQRDATRQLATGRTEEAIDAYADRGHVKAAPTREAARGELVERWDAGRVKRPSASRLMLAHTREEVRLLNQAAREKVRASGQLSNDVAVATERGERKFAAGDRVMFLRNERELGVKNGTLGQVQSVTRARMVVMLDGGRSVAFDFKDYAHIDHGYAATIHKAQGVTVDRVHMLATPGLDRHAAYVALTRHREHVALYYGEDDFADHGRLVAALSRERAKDMASDYARAFADRREIRVARDVVEQAKPAPVRSIFAGLKLTPSVVSRLAPERTALESSVERYARAQADILRMRKLGLQPLPHQQAELDQAAHALNAAQPEASRDLRRAFIANLSLVDEAAKGRTGAAIRAMRMETELRLDITRRADDFVQKWRQLDRVRAHSEHDGDYARAEHARERMVSLIDGLHRDPQLESLLRTRRKDFGISGSGGASLSHELQDWLGRSRSRGLEI